MIVDNKPMGGAISRNLSLDIFRISLALLIFLFHSNIHLGCQYGLLTPFISYGNVAMTGFFMLSGYAMTLGYGKKSFSAWEDISNFYKKRFITIYPLYIVTGTLFVIMNICVGKQSIGDNIILLPVEILGLQAIFPGSLFEYSHNSGTWFVSCMILCYILYPILLLWVKSLHNIKYKTSLVLMLFLLIYLPLTNEHFSPTSLYANPFVRLAEFIVGILLAFVKKEVSTSIKYLTLFFGIIILITGVSFINVPKSIISAPCFALIIWAVGNIDIRVNYGEKKLIYLSSISYAFFLSQFFIWNPLKYIMLNTGRLSNIFLIVTSFVACIIISVILYEYVDKKSRCLLNKYLLFI